MKKAPPSANPKTPKNKIRLDVSLVERGLAETRQRAQALIMAGEVRINGQPARKPAEMVTREDAVEIAAQLRYASRAGLKLEGALADFGVSAEGCICLDVGASNGGFSDCLLQHGVRRVYAVDVNTAQLDWKLRKDARVVAIKKNARYLKTEDIAEPPDFVTIDVSFISVTKVLGAASVVAKAGATFLILVKPQFELEKKLVSRGGIVRDVALHDRAVASVQTAAEQVGLTILGVRPSRITGAEGNQEFFLLARRSG
jgi:23S rRNA (cytidine1920-2'-O)/16S rRNA (cytidine1409-2'-O)-methyltransferase